MTSKYNSDINLLAYCGFAHELNGNTDKKRLKKYQEQRKERGFDDTELWSLYWTVFKFFYPRFKAFINYHGGYPGCLTEKRWDKILKRIEKSLDYINDPDNNYGWNATPKHVSIGLGLLERYYRSMWT